MPPEVIVRRIRPDEAAQFRTLRLAALLNAPDSFTETHAEAVAQPDGYWVERAKQGAASQDAVIAFAERGDVVGVSTGYVREPGVARLAGMWVAPQARGSTVSADLVEYVVGWARDIGCRAITLGVTETNTRAFRLYERCGFDYTGEPRLPIRPSSSLLAVQMIRKIRSEST